MKFSCLFPKKGNQPLKQCILHILRNNERTKNRNGNSKVYRREYLLQEQLRKEPPHLAAWFKLAICCNNIHMAGARHNTLGGSIKQLQKISAYVRAKLEIQSFGALYKG